MASKSMVRGMTAVWLFWRSSTGKD